jgi:hypothetical protein
MRTALATALVALAAAEACAAACLAFAPIAPGGVGPLACACAALLAVTFAPLVLGHELARKKLWTATILWPLGGFAGYAAAFASGGSRYAAFAPGGSTAAAVLAVSAGTALVAFAVLRSGKPPEDAPPAPPRPLGAVDRETLAELNAAGMSPRTATIVATPGWLIAAQIGLVGTFANGCLFQFQLGAVAPQANEPAGVAAALVVALAYLRAYYYTIAWFSYRPARASRAGVAFLFAFTIAALGAGAALQLGILQPLAAARLHHAFGGVWNSAILTFAAIPAAIDAYVLSRVLRLDVARLAERGYRLGDA